MKTLILYATKYGATQEIAARLAQRIDGAVLHNLKEGGLPALADFDRVIIGSSLYAGSIRKEAKAFLTQNANAFQGRQIGLFLSGMSKGEAKKAFTDNFPPALLQAAKATDLLGGRFDPQKAKAPERLIMKLVTKTSGYVDTLDDEKIKQFADVMQG
ncbi:MAG: flavodoxin domain-containing protein [Oscillospiraceae bacterium]|nr:flavodoxin domain-containing protein [Oscillospiraceae bacterium]